MLKNKSGKQQIDWWVVLVIGLLAYAFIPGIQNFVNGMFGQAAPPADGDGAVSDGGFICPIEDTTVQLDTHNKFQKGTDISDGAHRVFVDGVDRGYIAESGTFTASPGQDYMIIMGENSTTAYSVVVEGTIPCRGTLDIAAGLATYDNTLTFTTWNENGEVLQQSSENSQDMGANSVFTLPFKVSVTSKQAFGNPDHPGKGNVLCLSYNKSKFDEMRVDGAAPAPTPNQISTGSNNNTDCWYIPVIQNDPNVLDGTVISNLLVDGKYEGNLIIDTANTYSDPLATEGNLTYIVVDTALDLHGDSLDLIFSYQDEANNDLGSTTVQTATFGHS